MNFEFICGVLLFGEYEATDTFIYQSRNIFCTIVFLGLESEEKRSVGFAAQQTTIGQKMAYIQILQVIGNTDNLQRMNSLYDFV